MMNMGKTIPANHGSKYTNISWSPRKYQGALDGFGVDAGFAGSSNGAATKIDQTIKNTINKIKEMNSI